MKNFSIKAFLVLAISILSLTITATNNAEANMFNKFRKGFYFEKYKTAEEAKAALLELHPIGSDVEGLVMTLEGAGAVVNEENLDNYHKFREYDSWWKDGVVKMYSLKYDKASPFFVVLNWLEWTGTVQMNKEGKIIFIGLRRGRAY